MPAGDRTGPNGQGPMTGGARGFCTGFNVPGYATFDNSFCRRGRGRGFGFRQGLGRGMARQQFAPQNNLAPDDVNQLKAQAQNLVSMVDEIKARIENLENNTDTQD